VSDEHKRNAKIISEAIAELEKDPVGMALAFLNTFYDSKKEREAPEWMIGTLDEFERIAKENNIDIKDLHITPVVPPKEEE